VDAAQPPLEQGQLVAGRYVLQRELARGGMGVVWVALDRTLGRPVALKVLGARSLAVLDDARERFEREARAVAQLRSKHVVQVHDFGIDDGRPYIAMELLEGEGLNARLDRRRRLDLQETAVILQQIGRGLRVAHRSGLVHRDLKPSNVFLARDDDEEMVKILDFGTVKGLVATGAQAESESTASGLMLGTPQYMSPEQARGVRDIDHRSDLWSLAVIVYKMLTGVNPFVEGTETLGDVVINVCTAEVPPPSALAPELPELLDDFFLKALERDREARYPSVDSLVKSFMMLAGLSSVELDPEDLGSMPGPVPSRPGLARDASSPGLRRVLKPTPSTPIAATIATKLLGGGGVEEPTVPSGELLGHKTRRRRRREAMLIGGALPLVALVVLAATREGEPVVLDARAAATVGRVLASHAVPAREPAPPVVTAPPADSAARAPARGEASAAVPPAPRGVAPAAPPKGGARAHPETKPGDDEPPKWYR
jgi:serine/threonine-protein kinase